MCLCVVEEKCGIGMRLNQSVYETSLGMKTAWN